MTGRGYFVTGTDTGVGKTYASRALIAGWRSQGLTVGVLKPAETGCREAGRWTGPRDAMALLQAAGSGQALESVCPYTYDQPLAPSEAAEAEGRSPMSFARIEALVDETRRRFDVTLVEGAGGLLVPFSGERTAADLAVRLDLPLVVVARIGLGTINHTWLTVEAARLRSLEVAGVIFSRTLDPATHPPGPDEARNPGALKRFAGIEVLANLPFRAERPEPVIL